MAQQERSSCSKLDSEKSGSGGRNLSGEISTQEKFVKLMSPPALLQNEYISFA